MALLLAAVEESQPPPGLPGSWRSSWARSAPGGLLMDAVSPAKNFLTATRGQRYNLIPSNEKAFTFLAL
jgi:hypothetical protein